MWSSLRGPIDASSQTLHLIIDIAAQRRHHSFIVDIAAHHEHHNIIIDIAASTQTSSSQ